MKTLGLIEKKTILEKDGGVLYLYNDDDERAVKITNEKGKWKATVKYPWGVEKEMNYDDSDICGKAFVYGDVIDETEYGKFPEGFEISDMAKDDIDAYRNGEMEKLTK